MLKKLAVCAVVGVALGMLAAGCGTVPQLPGSVQVQSVSIMTAPATFTPAPLGIAARVLIDTTALQIGTLTNLIGSKVDGWVLLGVTNTPVGITFTNVIAPDTNVP